MHHLSTAATQKFLRFYRRGARLLRVGAAEPGGRAPGLYALRLRAGGAVLT